MMVIDGGGEGRGAQGAASERRATCGDGTIGSATWSALWKTLALSALLIFAADVAEARTVTIRWSSPSSPTVVTGFRIYTRTSSPSFGAPVYDGKPIPVANVYSIQLNISDVVGTYVTATAYNGFGESARSNEQYFAVTSCGNGILDVGEGCDDGNTASGDGCSSTCTAEVAVCGNGIRQGAEACDDGNTISWDGCSSSCTVEVPVCGNGHRQGSEGCDDGNTISGDGCSSTCTVEVAVCGNGIRQGAEACDDGNTISWDGCSSSCTVEVPVCGNGHRQGSEGCDDGNLVSGDGCSANCFLESNSVAQPEYIEVGGFIQTVIDTHGVLDGSIAPMGLITARIRYDADDTDMVAEDSRIGLYYQNPPTAQIRVEIGNYTIEVPESLPVSLVVYDDSKTGDTFAWRMAGDTFPFPDTVSEINFLGFSLQTTDTSVLSSDALPLGDFDIADFPNPNLRRFAITGCLASELNGSTCMPSDTLQIRGIIDTVPEPDAAVAAAAAFAALTALARRRRSSRPL